ncbi:winged helix-turn-helix domain-containing protein [Photobacterium sp. SDRW27]|uniref:winged helix-turn-helix domain-containing protein n=1 Tax=Photobacterium obscurum TaxID=2829490 RepID=UPI002243C6D7|nr:winged helix-turn-helix domain-containing protein [Photobacterium obscurum]MCW8329209.1 winged helix-turn-helix domain-containing protein [Photobacterium obscurum]
MNEQFLINNNYVVNFSEQVVQSQSTGLSTVLGSNEIALLRYFFDHPGITLSRHELLDKIWTSKGMVVEDSSLMNSVSICRKAFEDKKGDVIRTERGVGYRFVAQVKTIKATNESMLERKYSFIYQWLPYVFIAAVFAVISFFSLRYEPINDASEFLVGSYNKCTFTPPDTNDQRVYVNASVYQVEDGRILITEQGQSLSYPATLKEVVCE